MNRTLLPAAKRLSTIIVLCAALVPSGAKADDDVAKVEKLYAEGATLFNSGRYEEALEKFTEAYRTYPAANLLFNIARSHEALGKVDLALDAFRRFVAQPGVDPNTKALAERKINDLQDAKRKTEARAREAAVRQSGASSVAPAEPRSEPTSYSPWQYVALGSGAAVFAGGVTAMILGMKDEDDADELRTCTENRSCNPPPTRAEIEDKQDSADTKKVIGYALMGVGGAVLVTGGVLLVLDLTSGGERSAAAARDRPVAFGMVPLPGGGAASLVGRF